MHPFDPAPRTNRPATAGAATFLVPVSVRVYDDEAFGTVATAARVLREDLTELQYATLDGDPYDWCVYRDRADGDGYATVQATVRLTVAYPDGEEEPASTTVRALLERDLNLLSEVDPALDDIIEAPIGSERPDVGDGVRSVLYDPEPDIEWFDEDDPADDPAGNIGGRSSHGAVRIAVRPVPALRQFSPAAGGAPELDSASSGTDVSR